ncbi:hypothetical protein EDD11_006493 [Mortierella claussenii]|nr:hypothetical protein EDD11_006493 [Mortierella claussenii]
MVSLFVVALAFDLLALNASSAPVLNPTFFHEDSLPTPTSWSSSSKLLDRRVLLALDRRAPTSATIVQSPVPEPTTPEPAPSPTTEVPSTKPITTEAPPPVTTTAKETTPPSPPVTTPPSTTTKPRPTTTTTEEVAPSPPSSSSEPTESSSRNPSKPTPHPSTGKTAAPTGPINPPSGAKTSTATPSPTAPPTTPPTNTEGPSSGSKVLPIVLGTVLGLGALIGAGVFFFFRFRKNRRFDSKRPLSFLALSLDDPVGGSDSASSRAAETDAIYDSNRPITSQPSLRYTPPLMAGIMGSSGHYSYQSSEHSGATGAQFAQWSQDDENAALVGGPSRQQQITATEHGEDSYGAGRAPGGGYSQEYDLVANENGFQRQRPISEQSFVASSMLPLAPNDPLHARYNRQTSVSTTEAEGRGLETAVAPHVGSPQLLDTTEHVPLQPLNGADIVQERSRSPLQRPLSVRSQAASVLSAPNPGPTSEGPERQTSVRSTHSVVKDGGLLLADTTRKSEDDLQFL